MGEECRCAVCQMAESVGMEEALGQFYQHLFQQIEENGWTAIGVLPDEITPTFSYTIGASRIGQPDIIVIGVDSPTAIMLISNLFQQGEPLVAGGLYDKVLAGYKARLDPVGARIREETPKSEEFHELLGAEGDHVMLQLVVPDRNGNFPDHLDYDFRPQFFPEQGLNVN